jgi:hypothetical protein
MSNYEDVRKGVTQARYNENVSIFFTYECMIAGVLLGFHYKSFAIGVIGFFAVMLIVMILCMISIATYIIVNFLLSGFWATVVYALSVSAHASIASAVILGIIAFIITITIRQASMTYISDVAG